MADPAEYGDAPLVIAPMLATLGVIPVGSDAGWGYELKWDGVRAISYLAGGSLRVLSRNALDATTRYPELAELIDLMDGRDGVLDGEVVALDEVGHASFHRLQDRMHVAHPSPDLLAAVPVLYQVFDVLHLDGKSTLDLPYVQRRELLQGLGLAGDIVKTPAHFVGVDGRHVLTAAEADGLEGVVAKRLTSTYQPGRRSRDWIKVPLNRTQEVVIIGYKPGGGRRFGTLGSLALAVPDGTGGLTYAGGVGTGFTAKMLDDLQRRLEPLRRNAPGADVPREHRRGVVWVEPVLVGEIEYRNRTPDGRYRHPSWRGLRADRSPHDIPPPAAPPTIRTTPQLDRDSVRVDGAMQTPDGAWHVEAVHRGAYHWYRVRHGANVVDDLTMDGVHDLLRQAGIDLATLTNADPAA
jgi:bifunctional non-homologous end joining protein LigD